MTRHDEGAAVPGAGPKPVWFFAPDAAAVLIAEHAQAAFDAAVAEHRTAFVADAEGGVTIDAGSGSDALQQVWRDQVAGRARPDKWHVMRW